MLQQEPLPALPPVFPESSHFMEYFSVHLFLFLFRIFILNRGMGFSNLSWCSHSQKPSAWGCAVKNPGKLRGKSIPSSPTLPLHPGLFRILEFLAGNPKFPKFPLIPGCSDALPPFPFPSFHGQSQLPSLSRGFHFFGM